MSPFSRRDFIQRSALAALALSPLASGRLFAEDSVPKRKMTIDLVCGNLNISIPQMEMVNLAAANGFESVEANGGFFASAGTEEIERVKSAAKEKGVLLSAAGFPVNFRQEQNVFEQTSKPLGRMIAGLQKGGVTRMYTWISPFSDQLPYVRNFRLHTVRLKELARLLEDHGIRLGLEYVAPRTSWINRRFPFIHNLAEMRELIAEIDAPNIGLVMDCWHWWHAGETSDDILKLKGNEIIAVDVSDAPNGKPKEQLPDNRRELPCATGVIDIGAFLSALNRIGYDGPVRAEPFNRSVSLLPREQSSAAVAESLKKAFALIK